MRRMYDVWRVAGIWPRLISHLNDLDVDLCCCCPSNRKVNDPNDSARFRTDAAVKVGRGSRRSNEQTDFSVHVEAGSTDATLLQKSCLQIRAYHRFETSRRIQSLITAETV